MQAKKLGIDCERNTSELIEAFLDAVYKRNNVLILYDGADDLSLLEAVLPHPRRAVHVLVTSRCSNDYIRDSLTRPHFVVQLGRLGVQDARNALYAWSGNQFSLDDPKETRSAEKLVREPPIECLAIAVAHAGATIRKCKLPFSIYYSLLHEKDRVLEAAALDLEKLLKYFKMPYLKGDLAEQGIHHPHQLKCLAKEKVMSFPLSNKEKLQLLNIVRILNESHHVHLTWLMDIESIQKYAPTAMTVLEYFALMEHKDIPCVTVQRIVFGMGPEAHYDFRMALFELSSYTLVDFYETNEGGHCDIHSLVQSTVLENLVQRPQGVMQSRLVQLSNALLEELPTTPGDIQRRLTDSAVTKLVAHAYAVADKIMFFECADERCLEVVGVACLMALESQLVEVAQNLCQRRLKMIEDLRQSENTIDDTHLWSGQNRSHFHFDTKY